LGASDYIRKPFTPSEITRAVHRSTIHLERCPELPTISGKRIVHDVPRPMVLAPVPRPEKSEGYLFWEESWFQVQSEKSALAGVVLSPTDMRRIRSLQLPHVGDEIHQGLPMALFCLEGGRSVVIHAPLSGELVEVNSQLSENCNGVSDCFAETGWLVRIRPSRLAKESQACRPRNVILASARNAERDNRISLLSKMGCIVYRAGTWEEIETCLHAINQSVLLFDADSYGDLGPKLVKRIHTAFPDVKVVVMVNAFSDQETAYRLHHIFYYAIDPFVDGEIVDILGNAFCPEPQPIAKRDFSALPDTIGRIRMTNRQGTRISLMTAYAQLKRRHGLGRILVDAMLRQGYPVEVESSFGPKTSQEILGELKNSDRVILLTTEDSGRIPGSLTRKEDRRIGDPDDSSGRYISTLAVQPSLDAADPLNLDTRTLYALARQIMMEMERD
ncbi:MAG: hypothetical protein ABIH23_01165, partial [bacterium]